MKTVPHGLGDIIAKINEAYQSAFGGDLINTSDGSINSDFTDGGAWQPDPNNPFTEEGTTTITFTPDDFSTVYMITVEIDNASLSGGDARVWLDGDNSNQNYDYHELSGTAVTDDFFDAVTFIPAGGSSYLTMTLTGGGVRPRLEVSPKHYESNYFVTGRYQLSGLLWPPDITIETDFNSDFSIEVYSLV